MPPILASVVFYVFIGWLMYRESRRTRLPAALWLPTAMLAIVASKPIVFWIYGNQYGAEDVGLGDGNATDRNVLIVLFVLGILTLIRRGVSIGQIVSQNKSLLVLLLYLGASVFWSEYPIVALKRYIRELGYIIMILVVLTDTKPAEALHSVFARCIYVLVPLSVLYVKYYPEVGRYYNEWTGETTYAGVTTNKNTLGLLAMVGALVLVWGLIEGRRGRRDRYRVIGDITVLVMCLWLLKIADSQTSVICFAIGVLALLGSRASWLRARPARITWLMVVALLASAILFMSPVSRQFVAENFGRDPTLTTRTDIWAQALALGTNPVVGAGYNSVWLTSAGRQMAEGLHLAHAHNGYLEVYLNTGLVGVALLICVLLAAIRNASRQLAQGAALGRLLIPLCMTGMIYNYSEVTFNRDNVVSFGLFVAAIRSAEVSRRQGTGDAPVIARSRTTRLVPRRRLSVNTLNESELRPPHITRKGLGGSIKRQVLL